MAYCLMENHVHFLTYAPSGDVSLFMKKIGVSYAAYYNKKYDRVGHLFQDRYKSEPINDETHLLTVYRYILNNPAKAGISTAKKYPWSSYNDYFSKGSGLTDPQIIRILIGDRASFEAFVNEGREDECMEYEVARRDDEWALRLIKETANLKSGTELQKMDRATRDRTLLELKRKGISVRQLERLTGINRGVIQLCK